MTGSIGSPRERSRVRDATFVELRPSDNINVNYYVSNGHLVLLYLEKPGATVTDTQPIFNN